MKSVKLSHGKMLLLGDLQFCSATYRLFKMHPKNSQNDQIQVQYNGWSDSVQ